MRITPLTFAWPIIRLTAYQVLFAEARTSQ